MKKVHLAYPKEKADEVSQFIGTNELVSLVSWMEVSGMFGDTKTIYQIVAFPEDKADKVQANLQKYFITVK